MIKKEELLEFIDKEIVQHRAGQIQFCGRAGYHREDLGRQIEVLSEIRRLIEFSGAEVGDEKECSECTGRGYITVPRHAVGCDGSCMNCPVPSQEMCEKCHGVGKIYFQPRRTVSREWVDRWANRLHCEFYVDAHRELCKCLSELGIAIVEKEKI